MEWIFADIINSTKVPKVVKYIAITLLVGFLEFLLRGVRNRAHIAGVKVSALNPENAVETAIVSANCL